MELKPFYRILSYGSGSYKEKLHYMMMEKLENDGYKAAVMCPKGENINQWVAVHMVFFFNDINLLYGAVQEKCTNYSCPFMSAGVNFEYLWADKYKYKTPARVPAKTYIDYLLNWIVKLLEDERLFPPEKDSIFPRNYVDKVKSIAKRYFRVYAHIFYSHLEVLRKNNIEKMYYDSLRYFLVFIDTYSLVPSNDLRPLTTIINRLVPDLKITRLLNQTEEETRQIKQRLLSQKTTSSGRENSRSHSIDSNDKTSYGASRDEHANMEEKKNPSSGEETAKEFPVIHATSNGSTIVSNTTAQLATGPNRAGGERRGGTPDHSQGVPQGVPQGVSQGVSQGADRKNVAPISGYDENKLNWNAIMKEGGETGSYQPASYTGSTEGEENCECTFV